MYLSDKVAICSAPLELDLRGKKWKLPGASAFADDVRACPTRYVLFDDVRAACHELTDRWGDLLDPRNPTLRAPMEDVWLEWSESSIREQAGVLVNASPDGRSGSMRIFWSTSEQADAAQAVVLFDFDNPLNFTRAQGRHLYGMRALPEEFGALKNHLALAIDGSWAEYFRASALGDQGLPEAASLCSDELWTDVVRTLAFFVLLGSRMPFDEREVSRERLNVQRAKAGRPELLDHVELRLGGYGGYSDTTGGTGLGGRKQPRMHVVRGHLVRRNDSLFWRTAHVRGRANADAMPVVRHVRMSGR